MKVFSVKLRDVAFFGSDTSEQSAKVFSAQNLSLPNYESFPLYGIKRELSLRLPKSHLKCVLLLTVNYRLEKVCHGRWASAVLQLAS